MYVNSVGVGGDVRGEVVVVASILINLGSFRLD